MITLFLQASLLIWILVTLLWIWSIVIKNVSIIDIFWGLGFVAVNTLYVFGTGDLNPRKVLILVLVTVWGLRLAIHLAIRNIGKGEDFRYRQFRSNYGHDRYWWISYFQTFLLQGFLIMIVSLPQRLAIRNVRLALKSTMQTWESSSQGLRWARLTDPI